MATVKCPCGSMYKYTLDAFDLHTKEDQRHLDWIDQIIVDCPCGSSYNYGNQNNHFRSAQHKSWQSKDPKRFDNVQYICRCGHVFPYGQKEEHLKYHPK